MNIRLVSRLLGIVGLLIGGAMIFSLPWAHPALGRRTVEHAPGPQAFEARAFGALLLSVVICFAVGALLMWLGRKNQGPFFRREAMAVVGLSWVLATVLGAMPYYLGGVSRAPGVKMSLVDCLFESQSGFSTTGATVISDLETPSLAPHCILFWRSSTHFLGGLGIIVLFVVILGQGSAGKALMITEMPGPSTESPQARMQQTAWLFAGIYFCLNALLATILWLFHLTPFDALCHAFGTMATGGFSTYNSSVGVFDNAAIEYTIVVFMILAGTNFTLLYYLIARQPRKLVNDPEWRTYMGVIALVTLLVVTFGLWHKEFPGVSGAFRYGLFQVVSIVTTTGYGTHDFDTWNDFGRGALFLLMFVGGCAGSTGGGLKVIRHILFLKILRLELEQSYRPTVIRPLLLGGNPVHDPNLRKGILTYFGMILLIFVASWMFVVTVEPDATWGDKIENKLIDSASGVAATLNNIGPGLGTVGASRNYGHFSPSTKALFTLLMMIGRLEVYPIVVLFSISFWRGR